MVLGQSQIKLLAGDMVIWKFYQSSKIYFPMAQLHDYWHKTSVPWWFLARDLSSYITLYKLLYKINGLIWHLASSWALNPRESKQKVSKSSMIKYKKSHALPLSIWWREATKSSPHSVTWELISMSWREEYKIFVDVFVNHNFLLSFYLKFIKNSVLSWCIFSYQSALVSVNREGSLRPIGSKRFLQPGSLWWVGSSCQFWLLAPYLWVGRTVRAPREKNGFPG